MVYDLGIDVGTSYTAAAIRRADGTIEVVGLGPIADNIPSVVYLNDDGSLIVGDAAARRAAIDPAGAAREFKRRLGDSVPLLLGGSPFSASRGAAGTGGSPAWRSATSASAAPTASTSPGGSSGRARPSWRRIHDVSWPRSA